MCHHLHDGEGDPFSFPLGCLAFLNPCFVSHTAQNTATLAKPRQSKSNQYTIQSESWPKQSSLVQIRVRSEPVILGHCRPVPKGGGGGRPVGWPPPQLHKGPLFQAANTGWTVCCLWRINSRSTNTRLVRSAAPTTRGSWFLYSMLNSLMLVIRHHYK